MALQNVRATVRYVGTRFAGWQVQPGQRTIQGEIERALEQIANHPVKVHGAGRTDAGVHAFGQVCSFEWDSAGDLEQLRRSLSKMLAPDIAFTSINPAPEDFHARKSARAKRYTYTFSMAGIVDPFTADFAWTPPHGVNLARLRALCPLFEGERDFAGFQCSGASEKESTVRTLYSLTLQSGGFMAPHDAQDIWRLDFFGSGFLYKMVRNITGTLIDAARGQIDESAIAERLASPGPYRGYCAPAHGLALVEVLY